MTWTKRDETTPPPVGVWVDAEQAPERCRGIWIWRDSDHPPRLFGTTPATPSIDPEDGEEWCYLGPSWDALAQPAPTTTEHGDPIGVWLPVTTDRTGPVVPGGHDCWVRHKGGTWTRNGGHIPWFAAGKWEPNVTHICIGPKFTPPPFVKPKMTPDEAATLLERSITLDDAFTSEGERRNEALRVAVRALRGAL